MSSHYFALLSAILEVVAAAVADAAALAGVARIALGHPLAANFVTALLAVAAADRLIGANGEWSESVRKKTIIQNDNVIYLVLTKRREGCETFATYIHTLLVYPVYR